jgi:hypothetical protein
MLFSPSKSEEKRRKGSAFSSQSPRLMRYVDEPPEVTKNIPNEKEHF